VRAFGFSVLAASVGREAAEVLPRGAVYPPKAHVERYRISIFQYRLSVFLSTLFLILWQEATCIAAIS
jgi:hypothetical protein